MEIFVLTIFPKQIQAFCSEGILQIAEERGAAKVIPVNLRDYTEDKHRKVDDEPYGGGPGMVMKAAPIINAVEALEKEHGAATRILMTPSGETFSQKMARKLSHEKRIIIICGHYEGIDERVRMFLKPLEISIGDYVLSGGEAAAVVVCDAVVRLIPGVLGCPNSLEEESFSEGHRMLEYPHYTRPEEFRGMKVPDVLVSGNHKKISEWRRRKAQEITKERRPDLLT